ESPTTTNVFGDAFVNNRARFGLRAEGGFWIFPDPQIGIEVGLLVLGTDTTTFAAASDGSQILARPFIDATTGAQSSALIGFPGSSASVIQISDRAHELYTGSVDFREKVIAGSGYRLDALFGYRMLFFEEHLQIQQAVQPTSGPFVPGTQIQSI